MKIFSKKWWEIGLVGLILILAASVRLYRIEDYMMFLGDEGRDARVVAKILTGDMTFIGPMTSVTTSQGHMFLVFLLALLNPNSHWFLYLSHFYYQ